MPETMNAAKLTVALKAEATRLGFDLVGAASAEPPPHLSLFRQWLAAGNAGAMHYLADRAEAYEHPRGVLPGVQSVLMLGMSYRRAEPREPGLGEGRVSRYAWGSDYHDVIHRRLRRLAEFHRRLVPDAAVRGVCDTAPILERDFAQQAGLGRVGKNTTLIHPTLGSWFFLAALLTSEPLDYDAAAEGSPCGDCRRCLDACPTGALVAPYQLDARRCLSYLSVELRAALPEEFREPLGDRLFGCDACQDACPFNRKARSSGEASFEPRSGMNPVALAELFALDDAAFRGRFRHTPLWRARRAGILRNAAILLGNRPDPAAVAALVRGLNDAEPLVRGASAWALGRYNSVEARQAIQQRLKIETDTRVQREIEAALDQWRTYEIRRRGRSSC